jgi:pimeloyl-ACP methyl ester carboxylesterase
VKASRATSTWQSALLLALVALAATACTLPQAGMVPDSPEARRMPPVARLGRWDGARFVAVTPGSIPPSRLRVLVHGWTPGADRAYIQRERVRSWELVTEPVPEGRQAFEPWIVPLARRLSSHDPHAVVLAYSWVDDSATVRAPLAERRALGHTNLHGVLLAEALGVSLDPEFSSRNGQIQLLGHSYGARVSAVAAAERARIGAPVAQLTLFDAPDATLTRISGSQTNLEAILRHVPLGWGPGRTFVDNYVSVVGRRYAALLERGEAGERRPMPEMIDVVLAPPAGQFAYRPRHLYPMAFYERTPGTGVGYDWSPLSGRSVPPTPGCWEQRAPGEPTLVHGCTSVP